MTDSTDSKALHFRILADIARDLSGDVIFPTYLDASLGVLHALKSPSISIEQVAEVVRIEPLVASKLLHLANSVAYNPAGRPVTHIEQAIQRLGFASVRSVALNVAMQQMLRSRNLAPFEDIARQTWERTLLVAAISRTLARRLGRVDPEDALLAGLVCDIGVFYLLYRAAEYPEYHERRAELIELIRGWHASIGDSLLEVLGIPETVRAAIRTQHEGNGTAGGDVASCSLADVLHFATLLADAPCPWAAETTPDPEVAEQRARFADLIADAWDDIRAIQASLAD